MVRIHDTTGVSPLKSTKEYSKAQWPRLGLRVLPHKRLSFGVVLYTIWVLISLCSTKQHLNVSNLYRICPLNLCFQLKKSVSIYVLVLERLDSVKSVEADLKLICNYFPIS